MGGEQSVTNSIKFIQYQGDRINLEDDVKDESLKETSLCLAVGPESRHALPLRFRQQQARLIPLTSF